MACFRQTRKIPDSNDVLTILSMSAAKQLKTRFNSLVGTGSREQVADPSFWTTSSSSFWRITEKFWRVAVLVGRVWLKVI